MLSNDISNTVGLQERVVRFSQKFLITFSMPAEPNTTLFFQEVLAWLRLRQKQSSSWELCLLISHQPTTLHDTAASPASFCDCFLKETRSTWSWRWLDIAASPSPQVRTNEAGYDVSKTESHRDPSWHPFSSTSLTCQLPSPESMHMLAI